jgi:hypothetical protein
MCVCVEATTRACTGKDVCRAAAGRLACPKATLRNAFASRRMLARNLNIKDQTLNPKPQTLNPKP